MSFVVSFLGFLVLIFNGYFYLSVFQSKGYRLKEGIFGVTTLILIDTVSFVSAIACSIIFELVNYESSYFICLISLITGIFVAIVKIIKYGKLRAKFTPRFKRLCLLYITLSLSLTLVSCFIDKFLRSFGVVCNLSFILSVLAVGIMCPIEKRNNKKYVQRCKEKLFAKKRLIIGITGSAGKTSVKEMLKILLSPLGSVYATPKSYNTPMGIAKAVAEMPNETEIFIAEMGARKKNDISELLDIVHPDIGILTCIVPQHLETFGSINDIFKEKVKLLEASKKAFAGEKCKWSGGAFPENTEFFGESSLLGVEYTTTETKLSILINNLQFKLSTQLLGSVNMENLLLAIGVAMNLGVKVDDIFRLVPTITPPPHRLEHIMTKNGVLIIDDSFNINPIGANSALELLRTAKGRKIVTCSGFVEQGTNTMQATKMIVDKISDCADYLIILGSKNKKEIEKHIKGRIDYSYVANIEECTELYSKILKSGDTLLILADIPMSYNL